MGGAAHARADPERRRVTTAFALLEDGHQVILPAEGAGPTPRMAGMDEDRLIGFAPLGQRLRITGVAEFAG